MVHRQDLCTSSMIQKALLSVPHLTGAQDQHLLRSPLDVYQELPAWPLACDVHRAHALTARVERQGALVWGLLGFDVEIDAPFAGDDAPGSIGERTEVAVVADYEMACTPLSLVAQQGANAVIGRQAVVLWHHLDKAIALQDSIHHRFPEFGDYNLPTTDSTLDRHRAFAKVAAGQTAPAIAVELLEHDEHMYAGCIHCLQGFLLAEDCQTAMPSTLH